VGVQEVRWDKQGTFNGKGNKTNQLGTEFFVHHSIVSAVMREEYVSDRMSYVVLRGHWCNIIILNVHASLEEKSEDSNDNFYEELDRFSIILLTTI
jgi:hypothetical protein